MALTDKDVKAILTYFGLEDEPVAVVAIRGKSIGVYDDRFYHCIGDNITHYPGNTDPSSQAQGRATLAPMRVFHWRAGIHGLSKPPGRRYPAFVQAEEVTVLRFKQGAETGLFGINHHRGGVNGTSSLGCQTYPPDIWEDARHNLYKALGTTVAEIEAKGHGGKTFPYVVVPSDKVQEILDKVNQPLIKAETWSVFVSVGGEKKLFSGSTNIAGHVFVPVRDFCSFVLGCEPEKAPLEWVEKEDGDDVLKIKGVTVSEVCEINDRAFVWIVEVAKAFGYAIQRNDTAKDLILTEV